MSNELKKYTDLYNKYFNNMEYNLLNLIVIDEIKCQLEDKISDEDYNKLFYTIKNCYLKDTNTDLWCLTNYCLKNIDNIENMSTYEIINESNMLN